MLSSAMSAQGVAEYWSKKSPERPVWVAGGAVRDILLGRAPKDFDVFVGGAQLAAADVQDKTSSLKAVPLSEFHRSEPFLVGQWYFNGSVVQVMSRAGIQDVNALLETFDWIISLFAVGADGLTTSRCSVEHIKPGGELRLQGTAHPLSTLRRGFRFAERYGMRINSKDLKGLCERVALMLTEKDAQ